MNSEEQIINAIADACEDDQLRFQIIIQNNTLHVYINRSAKADLDYQQLKHQIYGVISNLPSAKFSKIWLYCRILGEVEPDWQSVLEVEASNWAADEMVSMVQVITSAVDATNSIVDRIEQELEIPESFIADAQIDFEDLPSTGSNAEELWGLSESELSELLEDSVQELNQQSETSPDLNKYCFIRNRRLLYAVLDPPWIKVARLLDTFDQFKPSIKRSQLPILEAYFEESINPDLQDFTSAIQSWWSEIQGLDSDNRHKLAIWLSRYCLDEEQTRSTIQAVLTAQANPDQNKTALAPEASTNFASQPTSNLQISSSISPKLSNQVKDGKNSNPEVKSGLFSGVTTFVSKLWKNLTINQTK